ncbi:hypothetical protein C8R44DRAFT_875776 [Mycena epipterygia]|nr:hypothetical protein C8R44DRAFT_875776 [Mycena epipterygia]
MPVTRRANPPQEKFKKKKKPPACDSCKARRVLCHPTTDGTACPRCVERGTKCTTTPVARGRPPKAHLGMPTTPLSSASEEPEPRPSTSHSNASSTSPVVSLHSHDPARFLELSPELVRHLFECFTHLPQCNHPIFRGSGLRNALAALSWRIYLLPPQQRVLAHCVVALSASISFDNAIVGPGPHPASFTDRSVFTRGADLRSYGIRRAPMYRALRAQALRFATEAGILLEPSEDNAASCFFMQFLENENEARSRPWAVAYLSHVRAIAASWDEMDVVALYHTAHWTAFLMTEALETTIARKPMLVSHNDQLLIAGSAPLSLQDVFAGVQATLQASKEPDPPNETLILQIPHSHIPVVFKIMRPFEFHVTRLARQLSETIAGGAYPFFAKAISKYIVDPACADFARRQPLDEPAVNSFLSGVTLLRSIRASILNEAESEPEPNTNTAPAPTPPDASPLFHRSPQADARGTDVNKRVCAYIMTFSCATLVLALHRELTRRASVALAASTSSAAAVASASSKGAAPAHMGTGAQGASERLDVLRRQTRELAGFALADVARALRVLPSLPHLTHVECGALMACAQFCLDEADEAGGVPITPEQALVMDAISDALKLVGYSWTLPAGLVERLDACVAAQRAFGDTQRQQQQGGNAYEQQQTYSDFGDDAMFMDMFPTPLDGNSTDMAMAADGGEWPWMGMFTAPMGTPMGTVHGQGMGSVHGTPMGSVHAPMGTVHGQEQGYGPPGEEGHGRGRGHLERGEAVI